MNKTLILFLISALSFFACSKQAEEKSTEGAVDENPFFSDFDTPYGVPPFDKIKIEHYVPAFKEGIKEQENEIVAIASNPEDPTFENTLEALEKSGALLRKVGDVFDVLDGSMTNEDMQAVAREVAPLRSKSTDDIMLNEDLFKVSTISSFVLNLTETVSSGFSSV